MKARKTAEKPFGLRRGKTALVVVDLQNEFVRDGGLIQVKDAKATLDTNKKLIEFFRKNGMPVVCHFICLPHHVLLVVSIRFIRCHSYHSNSRSDLPKDNPKITSTTFLFWRRKKLNAEMIRNLHKGLGIPAEVLIQPYRTYKNVA